MRNTEAIKWRKCLNESLCGVGSRDEKTFCAHEDKNTADITHLAASIDRFTDLHSFGTVSSMLFLLKTLADTAVQLIFCFHNKNTTNMNCHCVKS